MASDIARRTLLSLMGAGAASAGGLGPIFRPFAPSPTAAQPGPAGEAAGPTPAERATMASSARAFKQTYGVPGFSVAVGHAGEIIYHDAFGFADREPLSPMHLFRIASVSKPITSSSQTRSAP